MKLTNYMRDAFLKRVMEDVPSTEYDEEIRKALVDAALALLPDKVRPLWKNLDLRGYLHTTTINAGGVSATVPIEDIPEYARRIDKREQITSAAGVVKLGELKRAQEASRGALRKKLYAVAYSVTTRKALADALPEFEKYLPADEPAALRSLPVVANVVADFVKAGWPKGSKATTVAA